MFAVSQPNIGKIVSFVCVAIPMRSAGLQVSAVPQSASSSIYPSISRSRFCYKFVLYIFVPSPGKTARFPLFNAAAG